MNFWWASAIYGTGTAMDIWATLYAQRRGASEGNAVMADSWGRLNVWAKVILSAAVWLLALLLFEWGLERVAWALAVCGVALLILSLTSFVRFRGRPRARN